VQAALLAKNGTTNFNRKGEWGGALNNLYLFYNAAVQGTAQLVRVLRSPAVVSAMAGVAGIGAMLAFYGASAGGEDDDGEAYWDKIPSYVKERNMVIMLPLASPWLTVSSAWASVADTSRCPCSLASISSPTSGMPLLIVFATSKTPSVA